MFRILQAFFPFLCSHFTISHLTPQCITRTSASKFEHNNWSSCGKKTHTQSKGGHGRLRGAFVLEESRSQINKRDSDSALVSTWPLLPPGHGVTNHTCETLQSRLNSFCFQVHDVQKQTHPALQEETPAETHQRKVPVSALISGCWTGNCKGFRKYGNSVYSVKKKSGMPRSFGKKFVTL